MNILESLARSIKMTLTYFDLTDFPLTKEELFVWLWEPPASVPFNGASPDKIGLAYTDFLKMLEEVKGVYETKHGYYFLPGRENIIDIRHRRLLISEKKLTIARRAARLIRSVPFLKAIFVCNTVGAEQANEDSDIDFFIITTQRRIWITRLLVTFVLEVFRLRRTKNRVKNKICLSFYVTDDSLDLSNLRVVDDDVHFAFWIHQMVPIFDPEDNHAKFLQANSWIKTYLPNLYAGGQGVGGRDSSSDVGKIPESRFGKIWKRSWEKMWEGSYGDLINNEAKKIQISKMKFSGKKIDRGEDKGVVISDSVLKFHEKDTRIEYRQMWKDKLAL